MPKQTLMDKSDMLVTTFMDFPNSPTLYVSNLKADGSVASTTLVSLAEMQTILDEAVRQGWQRPAVI